MEWEQGGVVPRGAALTSECSEVLRRWGQWHSAEAGAGWLELLVRGTVHDRHPDLANVLPMPWCWVDGEIEASDMRTVDPLDRETAALPQSPRSTLPPTSSTPHRLTSGPGPRSPALAMERGICRVRGLCCPGRAGSPPHRTTTSRGCRGAVDQHPIVLAVGIR